MGRGNTFPLIFEGGIYMAKFISKCANQTICMKPNRVQIVDGIAVNVAGQTIRFNNGEYETTDKKEIDFLRKHRLYNVGFTEAPAEA
jgi:hypothetical protein